MSEREYSIDPELLREFLDETTDSLSPLENLLIKLEGEPENIDLVNSVFRPIHSLKGTAAFFKMMKTRDLSHAVENLLDLIRKKRKKATKEAIRHVLDGLDMLREMLGRVRANAPELEAQADYDYVLEALAKASIEEGPVQPDLTGAAAAAVSLILEFRKWLPDDRVGMADEVVNTLRKVAVQRSAPSQEDNRPAELCGLMSLLEQCSTSKPQPEHAASAEKALVALRGLADSEETSLAIDAALDEYRTFMGSIGFDPLLIELLKEKCGKLSEIGKWRQAATIAQAVPADGERTQETQETRKTQEEG